MNKKTKMKAKVMENKLSRLGMLGFLGLVGIGSGLPYLSVFLIFALFLLFTNVKPDEMFQHQVQKAGLRAFYVYLASTIAVILFALFRAVGYSSSTLANTQTAIKEQIASMGDAFGWIFALTVCVFAFTLFYDSYREKKALDEPMFGSLREIIAGSPVWGAITMYYIVSFIGEFGGVFIALLFVPLDALDGSLYLLLAYAMVAVVTIVLAGELFGFARLGLKRQGLKYGLLWSLPSIVVLCLLAYLPAGPLLYTSLAELVPVLGGMALALLNTAVIAIYNEVLRCGLVLNILMEHWGHRRAGIWRALLLSSVMFSLLTLVSNLLTTGYALLALGNFIAVFSYSMFFGALYLRSGNLWAVIATYACYLGFDMVSGFLTIEGYSLGYAVTAAAQLELIMILKGTICHALLLIPAYFLARGIKPRPPVIIQEPEVNGHAENPA